MHPHPPTLAHDRAAFCCACPNTSSRLAEVMMIIIIMRTERRCVCSAHARITHTNTRATKHSGGRQCTSGSAYIWIMQCMWCMFCVISLNNGNIKRFVSWFFSSNQSICHARADQFLFCNSSPDHSDLLSVVYHGTWVCMIYGDCTPTQIHEPNRCETYNI